MTRLVSCLACWISVSCSQTAPPIDTPATLPPAEPPADVTRDTPDKPVPDHAKGGGKPEPHADAKPVAKP